MSVLKRLATAGAGRIRFLLLLLLLTGAIAEAKSRKLRMAVGETMLLPGASVTRLAVSDSEVIEVRRLDDNQILLFGKDEGYAGLTIWRGKRVEKVRVEVIGNQVERFLASCASLMGEPCKFLHAANVEGRVVVTATVGDVETYDKIRKIRKAFRNVEFMVDVQPKMLDVLVPVINAELKKAGLENAHVERSGGRLVLRGLVETNAESRQAELIVEAYYGGALERE